MADTWGLAAEEHTRIHQNGQGISDENGLINGNGIMDTAGHSTGFYEGNGLTNGNGITTIKAYGVLYSLFYAQSALRRD